jgi:RimJ/RimL family protein N-acetyltransferase
MPEASVLPSLTGEPLFETARLACRKWRTTDVDALFEVYGDPVGARWVDDGSPITRAECEAWLEVTARNYSERGYGMFALDDRASAQTIGFCGLVHPGGQAEAEVKYALLRARWGQGLASEAVPAIVAYGAQQHALTQVIATVAPENLASQRVLRKAGFTFVAERRDTAGDLTRWFEWRSP